MKKENTIISKLLLPSKGDLILDIGCRFGEKIKMMEDSGATFIGVDISRYAIYKARDSFKNSNRIHFLTQDAMNPSFKSNLFDKIYASHVIEHIDIDSFLREIRRVLKPGGKLIIIVPNEGSHFFIFSEMVFGIICKSLSTFLPYNRKVPLDEYNTKMNEVTRRYKLKQHINEFTSKKLRNILESNGFTIQESRGFGIPNFFGVYTYHSERCSRFLVLWKKIIESIPVISNLFARTLAVKAVLKDKGRECSEKHWINIS